jgi:HAD superfamily hydrolase (TIGR01484 family)
VALDIDGTLVDHDAKIPFDTVATLDLVRSAGHEVVLATGRSLVGLVPIATRLGITEGWAVGSNGALTVRLTRSASESYVIEQARTFDPGPVIRRALDLAPNVRVGVEEIGSGWRVNRRFDAGQVNGEQSVVRTQDLWAMQTTRVILEAPGAGRFTERLRAIDATLTPAGPNWSDATAPGTSKAAALDVLRERFGIPVDQTVAVGDGVNDVDMLRWAGRGVAMGHASASVRDAADEVTGPIRANGVVSVLRSLLPPSAKIEGLSPLAGQLSIAVSSSPGPAVLRVWHDRLPGISRCEVWTYDEAGWLRHAPIPSGAGTAMRAIEAAAREAGLEYPRGAVGRRRARWGSTVSEEGQAGFELPLDQPDW